MPRWRAARVDWFDTAKGFGFLAPARGPAVFVDYHVIDMPGYKTLTPGQPVVYTATDTGRGPEATRVIPYPATGATADSRPRRTPSRWRRTRCQARAA
ncbi:cold shock domain-containing protein [Nocardia yunnanensis]|uniref:Cold shock domain-containing protein n=2 Tax=Nocardia yunnanensis TaxID=2382165 RepID=A0A386ZQU0_9NOCA|nr:cold shock domain-containing protein [Nocardia yunnanensis]